MKKGWHQRKHKRTSVKNKQFTAGSKNNSRYFKAIYVRSDGVTLYYVDNKFKTEFSKKVKFNHDPVEVADEVEEEVYDFLENNNIKKYSALGSYPNENLPLIADGYAVIYYDGGRNVPIYYLPIENGHYFYDKEFVSNANDIKYLESNAIKKEIIDYVLYWV